MEEEEEGESDIDNDSEPSEILFGEQANHREEEKDEDDMSSSSLNHWDGGWGRSTRTRRTVPPLSYTFNGLIVNFALSIPHNNTLYNTGVIYSCTSWSVYGSDAEHKMVGAIGKQQYSKLKKTNPF